MLTQHNPPCWRSNAYLVYPDPAGKSLVPVRKLHMSPWCRVETLSTCVFFLVQPLSKNCANHNNCQGLVPNYWYLPERLPSDKVTIFALGDALKIFPRMIWWCQIASIFMLSRSMWVQQYLYGNLVTTMIVQGETFVYLKRSFQTNEFQKNDHLLSSLCIALHSSWKPVPESIQIGSSNAVLQESVLQVQSSWILFLEIIENTQRALKRD